MGRASYIGPAGSGQIAKLANQIMVSVNIAGVAQALLLVLGGKSGSDPVNWGNWGQTPLTQIDRNRFRLHGQVAPAHGRRRTGGHRAAKGETNGSSRLDSHVRTMNDHRESRWRRADIALWQIWPQ